MSIRQGVDVKSRSVLHQILTSPFFWALVPSVLFYTVILSRNWIPIHDTFQITNIAYVLFNEVVTHHAIPLWYSYINYGVDTNWFLDFAVGPSLATLLAVARLLGRGDLLQYYYLSMFLDELVLLVGAYLLARALFKSRLTIFFVCIAMTGSTLWFAQPWFNFHLYYFVPLAAYFVVTGSVRNELWRILAGGLVLLISEFGNLPYFPVVHAFTYAFLVAGAWWAHMFDIRSALRRSGMREGAVLAACVLTAGVYLLFLAYGVNHVNYNLGREHTLVSAENFLTHGGAIGLRKFAELFTGTSWDIDVNAYAGVLVTSSAVFGLLWAPERRMAPFLGTAAFFTLLSMGKESFVAPLVYEIPGVAYYRHVGLVLPLIKVMLIVLSGFGFDALIHAGEQVEKTPQHSARRAYVISATILVIMLLLALALAALAVISLMEFGREYVFPVLSDATSWFEQHTSGFLARVIFVVAIYVTAVGVLVTASLRVRTTATVVGIALVMIQGIDVYSYRMSQFQEHMVPIDSSYRRLFAFVDRPFAVERTLDPMSNPAFRIIDSHFSRPIEADWYHHCITSTGVHCYYPFRDYKEGQIYNTIDPFSGLDPCRSIFKVDYWLPGVDTFYRAVTGMPLHNLDALPRGYEEGRIYFPINDKRLEKAIGCEFPKLQVFSSVTVIRDEREMAQFMRDPRYEGNLLLASGPDYVAYRTNGGAELARPEDKGAVVRPGANSRVLGEVRVVASTADSLTARTSLPESLGKYWLYVADAGHPFWHARVNGVETPILRANFGFQAVQVPGGMATVTFAYRSGILMNAVAAAGGLLIFTMLAVIVMAGRLLLMPC